MGANADTVRRSYEAFGKGDVPGVLAAFDPNIDWQEPDTFAGIGFENQSSAQDVAQNVFGNVMQQFPDFSVAVDEIHESGDVVFSIGRYRGTSANTGKKLDTNFAHLWWFGSDGKAKALRIHTDTHAWYEALGKA